MTIPETADKDAETRAIEFLHRRRSPRWKKSDQFELEAWLAESTLNHVTFLRCEAFEADVERTIEAEPKRFAALLPEPRGYARVLMALAASLMLAAGAGVWIAHVLLAPPPDRSYSTDVGGHATLAFSDGTQIALNTDTSVRVRLTSNERKVWLDKGEAYFQVAHDAARPFTVIAGRRRVTDLGTAFLVRTDRDRFEAALVQGRAEYSADGTKSQVATLTPGDEIVATSARTSFAKKTDAELADQMAWRTGLLKFRHTPLADAVNEYNRYCRTKLVIRDPSVARLEIGGNFKIASVDEFLVAMQVVLHLRVEQVGDAILISRAPSHQNKHHRQ